MNKITRRRFIVGGLGLITSYLAIDSFWYEKFFIEFKEHYIGTATDKTKNIKIVQISDLHLKKIQPHHIELVKEINRIKPELILFTGDVIDRNYNLDKLDTYLAMFDPSIQKTSILGNWECWKVQPLELLKVYDDHKCILMVNHSYRFVFGETSISITGMDDLMAGKADYPMAMGGYKPSKYHVIMTHSPQHRDIIQKQLNKNIPIDFILSGHTHGGQVKLFGMAPFRPEGSGRYVEGWYKESVPHLYVSRGIGTSGLPVRFGSRAEVSIFNLEA